MNLIIKYRWDGQKLIRRADMVPGTALVAARAVKLPWVLDGEQVLRRAKAAAEGHRNVR